MSFLVLKQVWSESTQLSDLSSAPPDDNKGFFFFSNIFFAVCILTMSITLMQDRLASVEQVLSHSVNLTSSILHLAKGIEGVPFFYSLYL